MDNYIYLSIFVNYYLTKSKKCVDIWCNMGYYENNDIIDIITRKYLSKIKLFINR